MTTTVANSTKRIISGKISTPRMGTAMARTRDQVSQLVMAETEKLAVFLTETPNKVRMRLILK